MTQSKTARRVPALLFAVTLAGCATQTPRNEPASQAAAKQDDFGVLVMAHGGSKQWNEEVLAAVEPLKDQYNLEVAFGMADAASMQEGVRQLESKGARRIGVVRLFVSGESFRERTEQILGMAPGAPAAPPPSADHSEHAGHGGHSMEFWKIQTQSSFVLSDQGLVEAPEMGDVLAGRAKALSREPQLEDVLILAHGPGDDAENERWLAHLEARADVVRKAVPFRTVRVETLREDWPEKREAAERRIRAFVEAARQGGGRAIVVPFRVQGFGPYAKVLEGLDYLSDGQGLIPHPGVTQWIAHQIETLQPEAQRE
jgi:sirohydrochlorin ferrochelatase